ncbi:MAG: glycoside hydrolase family 3 protein, partial [Rikenellaceae bacterium]|nr:glycoside hydrolase family 3 protein [Rikenellaceae bacterium]
MLASALIATLSLSAQIKLTADNIDQVVGAMTLEEKCHLVVGTSFLSDEETRSVVGYTRSIVPGAAGTTFPLEKYGIPAVVFADGPAGLRISPTRRGSDRTYYCTGFPIGVAMASSWNEELITEVGGAMGAEVLDYNVDVILGPGVNLMRNPLCGRNFEYYSEDPLLAGKSAAALIRGVQSKGVGTSIKHFAVNNQEINRLANDSRVDIRTLRELYLRVFQIAIEEAQPWTVMTSYNFVNGRYTSEDAGLLDSIMRREWGFRGAVVSDWGGGLDVVKQMQAGNDMLQPGFTKLYTALLKGVEDGRLDVKHLDACCRRILQLVVLSPKFRGYKPTNAPDLVAHAKVARKAAAEGMILLKNEGGALPVTTDQGVALFGTTSYKFIAGGTGSGEVNKAYVVDLRDGMLNAGYKLNTEVDKLYIAHMAAEKERL